MFYPLHFLLLKNQNKHPRQNLLHQNKYHSIYNILHQLVLVLIPAQHLSARKNVIQTNCKTLIIFETK